ncbi:MAG: T9SS type A sorting domain-containing protein [Chitinophagaceae bacterium]|nr:T9SS type A sorting domain-containing protein [Chitinophagaceae bacterium]
MTRTLPILSFILLMSLGTFAQGGGRTPLPDNGKSVKFYPNPATTAITFDLQGSYQPGLTVSIFSFLGKKMAETKNMAEKTNISLSNFNRGVYIFYITDASGKVLDNGKFQVSN